MQSIARRDLLKAAGAAAVIGPPPIASANARDLSDMAFVEAQMAEMRVVDSHYWRVEGDVDEAITDALWARYSAIGDAIAQRPITSPEGALWKAQALQTGHKELVGDVWAIGDQQRQDLADSLVDWLERQIAEATS